MSDTLNLANSIWPNGIQVDSDGYAVFYPLGTNKVNVPVNSAQWPKGDKLVSPFVYDKDDKVVGFIDTKALTTDSQTTIYLPYTHIDAKFLAIEKGQLQIHAPNAITKKASWKDSGTEDIAEAQFKYKGCKTFDDVTQMSNYDYLADIANGTWSEPLWDLEQGGKGQHVGMFRDCYNLTTFTSDLPSLICCYNMFANCTNLTTFTSDLPSLTDGRGMFAYSNLSSFTSDLPSLTDGHDMFFMCANLTAFTSDLPSLKNGYQMFANCANLTTFSSDLPSLTDGRGMFAYSNLSSFTSDLSSLTIGNSMFANCYNLKSFLSNLSSLTNGERMFNDCNNLTAFTSDLSSLTNGYGMFSYCDNLESFTSDLSSLTNGYGMFSGCKLDAPSVKNIIDTIKTVSSGALTLGIGCNNTTEDSNLFAQEVGYADMTSLLSALNAKGWAVEAQYTGRPTTTYGLRRPTEDTLPIFAKLEETEEHADYTSADGSKKYRLNWFHETTGSTEGHTQYATLEEAIETLNIKPIERNTIA